MLNSKSKFKKIICSSALCLGFLSTAFTGVHYSDKTSVSASGSSGYIIEDVTSSVFGTGYNFNVSTSDKPVSPSNWTTLNNQAINADNIKKGVVNFKDETSFSAEEWELTSQPTMPTDKENPEDDGYYKNLMINSYNGAGRLGYESNKSMSLEANSFYKISVLVYTHKTPKTEDQEATDPRASIYLTGILDKNDENFNQSKFEEFSTLGAWEEYSYYIDTDEAKTVKLQLWLGSEDSNVQGAVFFNKVRVLRYSEESYLDKISVLQDNDNDNFNIISFSPEYTQPVANSSFEDMSNSWTQKYQSTSNATNQISKIVDVNTFTKVNDDVSVTTPGSNGSINNQNALFLYNKEDGYQAVESTPFNIKQHSYYRLSFWAKSNCNTGSGATVKLVDQSEENPIDSASLTLSTTYTKDSNKYRNDWTKYTFYIYGAPNKDTNATIQIWLGTQDKETSGYVFVDDFRLEEINYATFSANSSATNATTFNLNNPTTKYSVNNGNFDVTQNDNTNQIYPAVPANWTATGSKNNNTFSGIINTSTDSFNANLNKFGQGHTYPTKPTLLPNTNTDNNNVLMIGSTIETNTQTYTSDSITLSANSYYKLSFYVMTDYVKNDLTTNYGARVNVSSSNKTIFDLYNIKFDDNDWHKIDVKIKTGANSETATIALSFNNLIGYVFFDQVELHTLTEAVYNDTLFEDAGTYKVDLSRENFDNKTFGKIPTASGIETPNSWKFNVENVEAGVTSGIISANNILMENTPPSLNDNTNYLYVSSTHDGYYAYTSKEQFTFNSQTYYKISVNVLTNNIIKDENPNAEYKEGASIALSDSSKILLKGIKTSGVWTTYTIYASFTESLTSAITLGLGYTDEACMGEVLFDNLTISTLDAEAYNTAIQEDEMGTYATFTDYTEPKEETPEESTPWENKFNWLIIPSLLTGLSIIIAVVGFYIKKINFNKKPKVKTNYDRRKTLDKDIDRREKIALRQQIIDELKAELSQIDKEIEDFNVIANEKLEEIKAQIIAEQEELKKQKLELEIRKKEATAEREKELKASPDFVSNTKAEKEYNNYIAKLDRQEMAIQKKISDKEFKLTTAKEINNEKLNKYHARQEYIRLQIAKIEAEIEEIARQEEAMWAEYKAAKADAKRRKAEYKAQIKSEKDKKSANKKLSSTTKNVSKPRESTKKTTQTTTTKTKEDSQDKSE